MSDLSKYGDIDYFFYHDEIDLLEEITADVVRGIVQPKNSLFYARNIDSAGVADFENWPNSIFYESGIRFSVIDFMARRNQYVTDGSNGQKDRRAVTSQNVISIESAGEGEKNISVLFMVMADIETPRTISLPLGVGV